MFTVDTLQDWLSFAIVIVLAITGVIMAILARARSLVHRRRRRNRLLQKRAAGEDDGDDAPPSKCKRCLALVLLPA